ncbi:MAG: TIGR03564 family F420-dependent LLM class oxidoreductase [Acidimicrobiales bacterium]
MRYGLTIDNTRPIPEVVDEVRRMADAGLASAAVSQIFGYDALTLLAVVGQQVPDIELVTAVVPTYPRHPIMLAAQALTVQAATGGRLTLGIGLSHQVVIEGMFGYSYDRPARHMRDYLNALVPLLRGEQVAYEGETLKAATIGPLDIDAPPPPVLVAALAPRMLELAGSLAEGTSTWMVGPATLASHIVPSITAAAEKAGRPAPRVAVSLPVCVTADPDGAREQAARVFTIYGQLPSYRAMLDREHAAGPADVAVVGDEDTVAAQIAALAEAGATDFVAAPYGPPADRERTFALVAELAAEGRS